MKLRNLIFIISALFICLVILFIINNILLAAIEERINIMIAQGLIGSELKNEIIEIRLFLWCSIAAAMIIFLALYFWKSRRTDTRLVHDFNNILTGIIGSASILRFVHDSTGGIDDKTLKENITIIEESAKKASSMVSRLL